MIVFGVQEDPNLSKIGRKLEKFVRKRLPFCCFCFDKSFAYSGTNFGQVWGFGAYLNVVRGRRVRNFCTPGEKADLWDAGTPGGTNRGPPAGVQGLPVAPLFLDSNLQTLNSFLNFDPFPRQEGSQNDLEIHIYIHTFNYRLYIFREIVRGSYVD